VVNIKKENKMLPEAFLAYQKTKPLEAPAKLPPPPVRSPRSPVRLPPSPPVRLPPSPPVRLPPPPPPPPRPPPPSPPVPLRVTSAPVRIPPRVPRVIDFKPHTEAFFSERSDLCSYQQQADVPSIKVLLGALPKDHADYRNLVEMCLQKGKLSVKYKLQDNKLKPSSLDLCLLDEAVRNFIANKFYDVVRIKNCYFTILQHLMPEQLCQQDVYDNSVRDLAEKYGKEHSLYLHTTMMKCVHPQTLDYPFNHNENLKQLYGFATEVLSFIENGDAFEEARRDFHGKLSALLVKICNDIQVKLAVIMAKELNVFGYLDGDAVLVKKNKVTDAMLASCRSRIKRELNIDVVLTVEKIKKPRVAAIAPTLDLSHLQQKKYVIIEQELLRDVSILEIVSRLHTAGYAVGVWTTYPCDSALHGFDFHMTHRHTVRASLKKRVNYNISRERSLQKLFPDLNAVTVIGNFWEKYTVHCVDRCIIYHCDVDDVIDYVGFVNDVVYKLCKPTNVVHKDGMVEYGNGKHSILPITFPENMKMTAISAGMGSGKSHVTRMYVEQFLREKVDARVLILTARIQQAYTAYSFYTELGFHIYKDEEGHLGKYNLLICSIESLHRIDTIRGFDSYDLVIQDEIRTIANSLVWWSQTNLSANRFIYRALMRTTRKHIWLDEDFSCDGMCSTLADEYFAGKWQLTTYTYKALERVFVEKTENEIFERVVEHIKNKKKVQVCFRSKRHLEAFEKKLLSKLPSAKMLVFKSEQDDDHIKLFEDINTHMGEHDAILHTSKVCISADIQQQVQQVFCVATGQGCTYRDMKQMAGRSRNVVDKEIFICMDAESDQAPCLVQELNNIGDREDRIKLAIKNLRNDYVFDESTGRVEYVDGKLKDMMAYKHIEDVTNFRLGFRRICRVVGYKFVERDFDDVEEKKKVLKANSEHTKGVNKLRLANKLERMRALDTHHTEFLHLLQNQGQSVPTKFELLCVLRNLQEKVEKSTATEKDYILRSVGQSLLLLDEDKWGHMTGQELFIMENDLKVLKRMKHLMQHKDTDDGVIYADMESHANVHYGNGTNLFAHALYKVRHVMKLFGFNKDCSNQVDGSTVKDMLGIYHHCEDVKSLWSEHYNTKERTSASLQTVVIAVGNILREVGYKFDSERNQTNGDRTRTYSIVPRKCYPDKSYEDLPNNHLFKFTYADLVAKMSDVKVSRKRKHGEEVPVQTFGDEMIDDEMIDDQDDEMIDDDETFDWDAPIQTDWDAPIQTDWDDEPIQTDWDDEPIQ
jgi:hypothetical protein